MIFIVNIIVIIITIIIVFVSCVSFAPSGGSVDGAHGARLAVNRSVNDNLQTSRYLYQQTDQSTGWAKKP